MSHHPAPSAQGIHQRQPPPASTQNVGHLNAHNGTAAAHNPNAQVNNGFYAFGTPQMNAMTGNQTFYSNNVNPTLYLSPDANIQRTINHQDQRMLVSVSNGGHHNYANQNYQMHYPHHYSVQQPMSQPFQQSFILPDGNYQYNYTTQQNGGFMTLPSMQQMQNVQPVAAPTLQPEPQKKKILKIVDPKTEKEVVLDTKPSNEDQSAASQKEQPVKEEKPEEDAKQRFAKAIATRAIDTNSKPPPEPKTSPSPTAVQSVSPAAPTPPQNSTPPTDEQEKPPTSASAPPPSISSNQETVIATNGPKAASLEPSLISDTVTEEPEATVPETHTPSSTPVIPSDTPTPEQTNQAPEEDFSELEDSATQLWNEEYENIQNRKYSFVVLDMFHTIYKRFKKSQPHPDIMKDLQRLCLDISCDPPPQQHSRAKYPATHNNFNPNWQMNNNQTIVGPNRNKTPYHARNSDSKIRRTKNNLPSRPSFNRTECRPPPPPEMLRPAENAWKPKRRADKEMDETEKKYEASRKEIRSILNKITPTNYEQLAQDFYALNVEDDPRLQVISIDLIFDKAIEEPKFCPLYTNICKGQVDRGGRGENTFFRALIQKCQQTFENTSMYGDAIKELQEKIEAETDAKKKADLEERLELLKGKEKRGLLGNIKFISYLYTAALLSDMVVSSCMYMLKMAYNENKDDIYVQYGIELLELVANIYFHPEAKKKREDNKRSDRVDNVEIFLHWVSGIKDEVSTKVKVMIMNFEDFVKAGYKQRNLDKGPKTIAEIHEDAKKEDAEKTKERNAYDAQQKAKERQQQPQQRYGGRASLEIKKNRNEKLASAANASSSVGNSAPKPTVSMKKLLTNDGLNSKLGANSGRSSFFTKTEGSTTVVNSSTLGQNLTVAAQPTNDHSGESDGGSWSVVGQKKEPTNISRKASRERH
ncbi:MIF4G domain-containing protein [Aphelenchoides besseyi]|nr:MIF4G domain-containing protein [Aphelenchoides besseyi]